MEKLLGLEKLSKELGKLVGLDTDEKSGDERLKAAILLIYNTSKTRIFQVADNVARGIIQPGEEVEILDEAKEPTLPETEEWDFQLGDTVKIGCSREDFKWMQRTTLGWKENLNQVYGLVGIVTNVSCKYDNSPGVYFPDVYTACSLYAGLLERVKGPVDAKLLCRWKCGDYVTTIPSRKVLKLLQRGLDSIPEELVGKRGRVIGVEHPCVIVTFDGRTTKDLKPSSLIRSSDDSPITSPEIEHARGFKVGEQVRIISNMRKLIKNQKDNGGWSSNMSPIRGKTATVVHVQKDGTLNVQTKHFRAWRFHPDSVLRSGEEELSEEDLKLLPGDIIKVMVPRNVRGVLAMADVPSVFLEYLRATAVVTTVDDDIDYYIRFNQDQHIQAHIGTFRNATDAEKQKHEKIEKMVEGLQKGDKVHLDIGPPNFVQSVIAELNLDPVVKMALTRSAELVGYIDPYTAVIEFEGGVRCRVKKKHLTVPDKFHVDESKDTLSLETAGQIRDAISRSVQDFHSREGAPTEDWKVEVIFMFHGNPPAIEFHVVSTVATSKDIFNWLNENSGWKVEFLADGQFMINGTETSGMEIKVGVVLNDETSEFFHDLAQFKDSKPEMVSGSYEEGAQGKNKAQESDIEGSAGHRQPLVDPPKVTRFEQFDYLRLYNAALARDVYFPYVIHGQHRTPVEPIGRSEEQYGAPSVVNNIAHVDVLTNSFR